MAIPSVGLNGVRQTVNAGISDTQTVWNVRSGLNVAALNCTRFEHAALVENYRAYLKVHSRELARANRNLGREFRAEHGRSYRNVQDSYMTQVYNYFALPPALADFCDVALELSREVITVQPGGLGEYSPIALGRMEAVFENFYRSFEQYRTDVAAWDARYGPNHGLATSSFGPAGETVNLQARYPAPATTSDAGSLVGPVGPVGGVVPADTPITSTHTPPSTAASLTAAQVSSSELTPEITTEDVVEELSEEALPARPPVTDIADAAEAAQEAEANDAPANTVQFVSQPVVQPQAPSPEG